MATRACLWQISVTPICCPPSKTHCLVQDSLVYYQFYKPSYSQFSVNIPNVCYHSNKGRSAIYFNENVKLADLETPCLVHESLLSYHSAFRREILKMAQKQGNLAAAHARKVLPFSVSNELGLENYLNYPRTKFGENRTKIAPASVDERENFVLSSACKDPLCSAPPDDVTSAFECYEKTLRAFLLDKHAPLTLKKNKRRPSSARWYDSECRRAKRTTRQLERKYRRLRTDETLAAWRQQFNIQRRLFQSEFVTFWPTTVDVCGRNPRKLWHTVNELLQPPRPQVPDKLSAEDFAACLQSF